MLRITAATAVLALAAGSALAVTPAITPGIYGTTLEFTNVTGDNAGICASQGVKTGVVQVGFTDVGGAGKTATGYTPVPVTTGSTLGVLLQQCAFGAYPATIASSGNTPYTGTTTCTLNGTTYSVVTSTGNGNIDVVGKNTYYINATSNVVLGSTTLCTITTQSLYLRSGK